MMMSNLKFCLLLKTNKNENKSCSRNTGETGGEEMGAGVRLPGCDPQLSNLPTLRCWTGYLIALCLRFLICILGVIIVPTSQSCPEDYMR